MPRSIGRLRRVRVAQVDPAAGDAGTGWYLAHVVVSPPGATPSDPASTITFPCNGWLGANEDCGGDARPAGVMARELAPPGAGPAASAAVAPSRPRPAAAAAALTFEGGAAALPHPEKVAKDGAKAVVRAASGHAGEDAYFLQARLPAGGLGLGVSDGVWMWRLHGIDAGAFSRALMRTPRRRSPRARPTRPPRSRRPRRASSRPASRGRPPRASSCWTRRGR